MAINREFDAIVIGGGLVGGYAAKELCEAGFKTLLLERGAEKKHPESYTQVAEAPWDFRFRGILDTQSKQRHPIMSKRHIYTAASADSFLNEQDNPYTTAKDKPYQWFRAYQLGGKSLQWGRVSLRFSDYDFNSNLDAGIGTDWPVRHNDLATYYSKVERYVGISGQAEGLPQYPDGEFLPPMAMNDLELEMRDIIAGKWPDRVLTKGRMANLTQPHNGRGACIYRGKCSTGCPHGGYYSSLSGSIPTALATGKLTIRCNSIAERILYNKNNQQADGVRVIDAISGEDYEYRAKVIFVCAATLNSTRLLLQSADADGVGLGSGELGHNLMDHHTMGVSAEIEGGPDSYPLGRRPSVCVIPRFQNLSKTANEAFTGGYGFQVVAYRQDWKRHLTGNQLIGSDLKEQLTHQGKWRIHIVGFGEVLPNHDNKVELDAKVKDKWGIPVLKITAEYKANELAMNQHMHKTAAEILHACGGKTVDVWDRMSIPGDSIHEVGTARMGRNPETSVLDPYCRMWEAKNVYVTDGSALPSSAWQNPSLTLLALTSRAVQHYTNQLKLG